MVSSPDTRACRARRAPAAGRKRSQALAQGHVVHSKGRRRIRRPHGRRADLYAETPDPERPVVCFDESPVQLIGEVRQPIPAAPGQHERYDCEYRRNGSVSRDRRVRWKSSCENTSAASFRVLFCRAYPARAWTSLDEAEASHDDFGKGTPRTSRSPENVLERVGEPVRRCLRRGCVREMLDHDEVRDIAPQVCLQERRVVAE